MIYETPILIKDIKSDSYKGRGLLFVCIGVVNKIFDSTPDKCKFYVSEKAFKGSKRILVPIYNTRYVDETKRYLYGALCAWLKENGIEQGRFVYVKMEDMSNANS